MNELWQRLRVLFGRGRFDRDLEEEMQFHLEMQAEENRKGGMPTEEARYAATFSILDNLLLRPLPVPQSDRLASVQHRAASSNLADSMSYQFARSSFGGLMCACSFSSRVNAATSREVVSQ